MFSKKRVTAGETKQSSRVVDRSALGEKRGAKRHQPTFTRTGAETALRGGPISTESVLQLQGLAGNGAVSRKIGGVVQRQPIANNTSLDMAECSLLGITHEGDNYSTATVKAEAWMSSPLHEVIYEIKWDAAVTPDGGHLGQTEGEESDWIVDLGQDLQPIGDRDNPGSTYFDDDYSLDQDEGQYFLYHDQIGQSHKEGGSWWFRLKVVDETGNVLSQSHDVEVDWGKPSEEGE